MAQTWAVLLSGEHPTLPAAELRALLAVHASEAQVSGDAVVAFVAGGTGVAAALGRMALAHAWGTLWGEEPDTPEGLERLASLVRQRCDGKGSIAVVSERRGQGKSHNSLLVERTLGAAAGAAGHSIDLARPDQSIFAWLEAGRIVVGRLEGTLERGDYEARCNHERAHFSPIALHPRRAAGLLHLARVKPGGRLYDPFCGTGTFVLEGALEGYETLGSDLDAWMVQGTLQALADDGPNPLDGTVFVADVADTPGLVGQVDGIVTDFPYGRASTGHGEELVELYGRAFAAFAKLLPPGARAVIGHPDPELLDPIEKAGFTIVERHAERAHRSLTRHFAVCRRL